MEYFMNNHQKNGSEKKLRTLRKIQVFEKPQLSIPLSAYKAYKSQ